MNDNYNQFEERRKYVRALYSQDILFDTVIFEGDAQPTQLKKPVKFKTRDISVSGLGVICTADIDLNTEIFFTLDLDGKKYDVKARVIYSDQVMSEYNLGLEFISPEERLIEHIKKLVTRLTLSR